MNNPPLSIYDTKSRKKRPFQPLKPGLVQMYCCGPTVYDYLHIGNFRGAVFFNFVRNWLEHLGYKVNYVYNFTDIDDKILNRAREEKCPPQDLAETFIKEFQKDYRSLKLSPHSANPRATKCLPAIIRLIERLIREGKAYKVEGDVFFSIDSFPDYGGLSGRKPEELLSGVRIAPDPRKKNTLDFALWKKSKPSEDWFFESPWGKGRPGWHIECTAMIQQFLGEQIDIHAGGSDLVFPHHENEIAQASVFALDRPGPHDKASPKTSKRHVQFWMHNNMIVTKGNKMSKSLGNRLTMRKFLRLFPGELFKFLILSVHYRSPLQFSKKSLEQALLSLCGIYETLAEAQSLLTRGLLARGGELSQNRPLKQKAFEQEILEAETAIKHHFNDDFATPKAFAVFFSLIKSFQQKRGQTKDPEIVQEIAKKLLVFFKKYGKMLALFQEDPKKFLKELEDRFLSQQSLSRQDIDHKIQKRQEARQNKDFKQADTLRQELESLGILIQDKVQGTSWRVKKFSCHCDKLGL